MSESYHTERPLQPVMASSSHRTGGSAHSSVAMMPASAYASAANGSACQQATMHMFSGYRALGTCTTSQDRRLQSHELGTAQPRHTRMSGTKRLQQARRRPTTAA